jgi:hypothetical protein
MDQASRLEEAATHAMELIEKFSDRDPSDADPSNPWRNPQQIFDQLDEARKEVVDAWKEHSEKWKMPESATPGIDESAFRALYLDMITDAFADVLDALRNDNSGVVDVNVLVDCLQSGIDFLTSEEKELLLEDDSSSMVDVDDDEQLTPHEKQRRALGFDLEVK